MPDIFVSYSRKDQTIVEELVPLMRRTYGHEAVWYDEGLRGGQDWWREILRQIRTRDIFCYLLSQDSLNSKYCRDEYAAARRARKRILPVQIRPDTGPIPAEIRRLQIINLTGGVQDAAAMSELYGAVQALDRRRRGAALLRVVLIVALLVGLVGGLAILSIVSGLLTGDGVASQTTVPLIDVTTTKSTNTPVPATESPTPLTATATTETVASVATTAPPPPSRTPTFAPNPGLGLFEIDVNQSVKLLTLTIGPTETSPTCVFHNLALSEADTGKTLTITKMFWPEAGGIWGQSLYRSHIGAWSVSNETVDIDFNPQAENVAATGTDTGLTWNVTSAGNYVLCFTHRISSGMPGDAYQSYVNEVDGFRYQVSLSGG